MPTLADPVFIAPPPPSRYKHWLIGAATAACAALVVIAISQWTWAVTRAAPAKALPNIEVSNEESLTTSGAVAAREDVPPKRERIVTAVSDQYEVPQHASGQPLDEVFYTLRGWLHPIAGADELMPTNSHRHFGAERNGIERADCGAGHCGIDLHGPRGRAIIAVASGTLVKVERRFDGGDGMSGRYVRIRHEDGSFTTYMHLDSVEDQLAVGDSVHAGQSLGKLGATGVPSHTPHLHFALELPAKPTTDDQHASVHFVNPAPFLVRSKVGKAERLHAVKPAF